MINMVIESFSAPSKSLSTMLYKHDGVAALKMGVHDYICCYNHERIKLALQGLSPVEYRLRNIA